MNWTWIEDDRCPICKGADVPVRYVKGAPYPVEEGSLEPLYWQLMYHECPVCGLRFMSPRPDADSYRRYYSTMAYRRACKFTQADMDAGEMQRAKYYENALTDIPYHTHLDVGCSRGYLLDVSRKKRAIVLGVEPNQGYTIEGIPTVESIDEVTGTYDLVTCIHVLEHAADPVGLAKRLIKLTAPGGVLVVEVPCDEPPGLSSSLSHPYAFQPITIKRLFSDLELLDYRQPKHQIYVMSKPEG